MSKEAIWRVSREQGMRVLIALVLALTAMVAFGRANAYADPALDDSGYYVLSTQEDLQWFADQVNSGNTAINAKLANDIVVSGGKCPSLGDYGSPFRGTIDGDGHTISGITWFGDTPEGEGSRALVYTLSGGTVKNLTLEGDVVSTGNNNFNNLVVTTFVEAMEGGTLENCVNKVSINATGATASGLVGYIQGTSAPSTVKNCLNVAPITGSQNTAGLISQITANSTAEVSNCGNRGSISGGTYGSGLISNISNYAGNGDLPTLVIKDCYNAGDINVLSTSANVYAGGIVARVGSSCVSFLNCYNVGSVAAQTDESKSAYQGQLVGYAKPSSTKLADVTVENSYCLDSIELDSIGYATGTVTGSAILKSLDDFKGLAASLGASYVDNAFLGVPILSWEPFEAFNTGVKSETELSATDGSMESFSYISTSMGRYPAGMTQFYLYASEEAIAQWKALYPNRAEKEMLSQWANSITSVKVGGIELSLNSKDNWASEYSDPASDVICYYDMGSSFYARNKAYTTIYVPVCLFDTTESECDTKTLVIESDGFEPVETMLTYRNIGADTLTIRVLNAPADEGGEVLYAKTLTMEDLKSLEIQDRVSTSANCGMAGLRSYMAQGVYLTDVLYAANVTLGPGMTMKLRTTDYATTNDGNGGTEAAYIDNGTFTYEYILGTPRYTYPAMWDEETTFNGQSIYSILAGNMNAWKGVGEEQMALASIIGESKIELESPLIAWAWNEGVVAWDGSNPETQDWGASVYDPYTEQETFRFLFGLKANEDGSIADENTTFSNTYGVFGIDVIASEYIPAHAEEPEGAWISDGGRWWYSHGDGTWTANGWELIDGVWYLFDADGWMLTGWQKWAGSWYYLQPSGALYAGWLSWGGSWYYLDPENDSAMATGWFLDGETWYYADASGAMQTGWLNDGGAWYYLQPSGAMLTGWLSWGGEWYFLGESGAMATGWVNDGGTWYYLYASGAMAHDCWVGDYYLTSSGAMAVSAWVDGGRYYVGPDGAWVPGA